MFRLRNENLNKGFSLIELIVVMAVLAILVLIATPRYLDYVNDARVIAMKTDIKVIEDAIIRDHIENPDNEWPVTDGEPDLSDEAKKAIVDDIINASGGFEKGGLVDAEGVEYYLKIKIEKKRSWRIYQLLLC